MGGGNAACGMADKGLAPLGGMPGLCGDPFQSGSKCIDGRFAETGMACKDLKTYQQGGILKTVININANHAGFWEVSICDSVDISQECFDKHKLLTYASFPCNWWSRYLKCTLCAEGLFTAAQMCHATIVPIPQGSLHQT